jgi:hypothetical protein
MTLKITYLVSFLQSKVQLNFSKTFKRKKEELENEFQRE